MRCKKHYTDLSSTVGVCASCLRERLCAVIAAQEQSQSQSQTLEEQNHNSDTNPVFPRSISPYITRRKTGNSVSSINNQHNSLPDRRFFSTPQVAPTTGSYSYNYNTCQKKQHGFILFSLLSKLFRSKKRKEDSDPRSSISVSDYRKSCGGDDISATAKLSMSSPFWISNIRSSGGVCRKKQPFGSGEMRKVYCPDRGMSPVRLSDCDGTEDDFCYRSSGYETCESRKQTPWRTPAYHSVRRGGGGGVGLGRSVSELPFCISPLVRASPRRRRNRKVVAPVDGGEIRAPVTVRSRKGADFGKIATNR